MIGVSWLCQTLPRVGDEDNGEKNFFLSIDRQIANAMLVEGTQWGKKERG